jgi:hypothetical protein
MNATLSSLILAVSLTGGVAVLPGCYATGEYVVDEDPPPPRDEVVVERPGFVYIHGHWGRDHGRWAWSAGRYERERHGYRYVDGRWEHRGNRHVWVDGTWRAEGGVTVR